MSKLTNKHNLPLSLAVFLANDDYTGPGQVAGVKTISVTTLLKSTRQIVLGFRLPQDTISDVSDMVASRLGQAYHTAVEQAWLTKDLMTTLESLNIPKGIRNAIVINPDPSTVTDRQIPIYLEQRAEMKIKGWIVSGKFDLVVNGVIEDIKSTSTYTYLNQTNTDKYAMQGSMYKLLNPDIITSDHIQIDYIFTDWSAHMARTKPGYPPLKVFAQNIPLHSLAHTKKTVELKLKEVDKYMHTDEVDIPYCSDEYLWRTQPVFQYFSNFTSTKSTKNFDTLLEANNYLVSKNKGYVSKKEGEVKACKYCSAFNLCSQKDEYIKTGELKL